MTFKVYGISGNTLFEIASFRDAYEANKYANTLIGENPGQDYIAARINEASIELLSPWTSRKITITLKT